MVCSLSDLKCHHFDNLWPQGLYIHFYSFKPVYAGCVLGAMLCLRMHKDAGGCSLSGGEAAGSYSLIKVKILASGVQD